MRKRSKMLFLILVVLLLAACPVFAQAPGGSGVSPGELKFLGGMIGLGIAAGLCGIGQGTAVRGAAEAIARNPGAAAGIRFALILGLVLIETLTIYAVALFFLKG